jgi:hypothetical protein
LENSSVVIGVGYSNDKVVHGAMFMLANKKAFYAVSANSKEIEWQIWLSLIYLHFNISP